MIDSSLRVTELIASVISDINKLSSDSDISLGPASELESRGAAALRRSAAFSIFESESLAELVLKLSSELELKSGLKSEERSELDSELDSEPGLESEERSEPWLDESQSGFSFISEYCQAHVDGNLLSWQNSCDDEQRSAKIAASFSYHWLSVSLYWSTNWCVFSYCNLRYCRGNFPASTPYFLSLFFHSMTLFQSSKICFAAPFDELIWSCWTAPIKVDLLQNSL